MIQNNKKINIVDIYRNVNLSTIFFLKLFDYELKNTYLKDSTNNKFIRYPLTYLAYSYGLLNCYIESNSKRLQLIFDHNTCISDLKLTESNYYNIIDYLIDSKYFYDLEIYDMSNDKNKVLKNKILRISLNIPIKYRNDVNLIIFNGKFSETSENFKKAVSVNESSVPIIQHPIARYIITKNLAKAIVNKDNTLLRDTSKILGVTIELLKDNELFNSFDYDKEVWSLSQLNKYT